uniref:Translocation protein SEC62 n=1 Tax=Nicotiana tabacum TaxID=4097 RepID=A0A1S4DR99_TOBAC
YFGGKDFVSFMRNHSELNDILESDRSLEPEDIANILLKKKLLVRCDRVVKSVRPGKKKLSAFPSHLEIYDYQVFSEDDAFFAWTFVKRRTLWQTLLSFFWPFLTLAICFFLYPHQVKLLIFYPCAGVLLLILCVLLLRAMVFCAIWILLGCCVWFFPNILAEEATLKELFQFWPQKDDGKQPEWKVRIFYEIVAVVVVLLLRRYHASDEAATASVGPYLDQST